MFTAVVVWGILLPGGVAAVVLAAGWRPWNRTAEAGKSGLAAGAVAMGGALIAAQAAIVGIEVPPIQAGDWLALLLAAAVLLGLVDALFALPGWLRWWLKGTLSAALPLLLLMPLLRHTWSAGEAAAILGALSLGTLGLWRTLDRLSERVRGAGLPLALGVVTSGSAAVLAVSGSASLGQLGGALAVAVGVALIVGLLKPSFSLARGAVPPLTVGLTGLWLNGTFYADVPPASLILLFAAPAFALIGQLKPIASLKPWQTALLRAGAVVLPLAAAAIIAYSASPPVFDEPYW